MQYLAIDGSGGAVLSSRRKSMPHSFHRHRCWCCGASGATAIVPTVSLTRESEREST